MEGSGEQIDKDRRIHELEADVQTLTEQKQKLLEELKQAQSTTNFSEVVAPLFVRLQEAEDKLQSLKGKKDAEQSDLEKQLSDAKQKNDEITIQAITERLDGLQNSIDRETVVHQLTKEKSELKRAYNELKRKYNDAKERLKNLEHKAQGDDSTKSPGTPVSPPSSSSPPTSPSSTPAHSPAIVRQQSLKGLSVKGQSNYAFTMRRAEQREEEVKALSEDLARWFNKVLKTEKQFTGDDLIARLSTGVDLCALLAHMSSSFKTVKYHPSAKAEANAQFAIENLRTFLKVAVEKLEIRYQYDPDRLQPRQVVLCVLDVARKAHEKYNLEPPDLIKLEMEIAREDAGQKEPNEDPISKQEEEKLEQEATDLERAVSEFCTKNNLKAPTRLKERGFGTYQFDGNRVAPVRVLHGKYFLVKDGDKWKDLRAFIGAKSDGKQASSSNLLQHTSSSNLLAATKSEVPAPSTSTTSSTDNKDVKTQVNEPAVPDERLSKAYAKIKELETENAKIESKRKQQEDDYEKQLAQLNAALKAANERKSTTVITLKSHEYQEEEEEEDEPQIQKNRGCWSWFSKEETQNKNLNRNYPKKKKTKKIEEEKQTTS